MSTRRLRPYLFFVLLVLVLAGIQMKSASPAADSPQVATLLAGRNVNMVSGTKLPLGDPWLQRQNEPSIAVSSRNPMHLFAAANDYRTIDMPDDYSLPGIPGASAVRDSWIGVFESFNGGESSVTMLLPGFPQDTTSEGLASPIHGFDTACDPIVRAGAQGLFYLSGIAFNRNQKEGVVFVARYVDFNNRENVEEEIDSASQNRKYAGPIKYIDTKIVDTDNRRRFIDMPNMAVDVPRGGAPYGNVYVAYTVFLGDTTRITRSRIILVRSSDGGVTWSWPTILSEFQYLVQRPVIVIDPSDSTGKTIYIVFRRFALWNKPDGIVFVKSVDGGKRFSGPTDIATLTCTFDQPTTNTSFRTNSYPTMAIDGNGIVYVAWAQRYGQSGVPNPDGQARIVISYSKNRGLTWSAPRIVDQSYTGDGHQFIPSMTFAGGKLTLAWYDQRDDIALHHDNAKFIEDVWNYHRHTIDVRAAEGMPGAPPIFQSSILVSRYLYYMELDSDGEPITDIGGNVILSQGQYNFINFPLFHLGTKPFHGDYMEIVSSPQILPPPATTSNSWVFNTSPSEPTTSPVVWTDTRDVWPPAGSLWGDWLSYNPPTSIQDLDFQQQNPCNNKDTTGMRNQNIYTANLNHGVIVGSPGNTKLLDIPRTFVVLVKNTTEYLKPLTLTIYPSTFVSASFEQGSSVSSLQVTVLPYSSVSCTVYVDPSGSNNGFGSVKVDVTEGGTLVGRVFLNPDSTNNPILDPSGGDLGAEFHNPRMSNPKVWKYDVGNPNEPNASFLSPRAQNPRAQNSGYINPRAQNEGILNPRAQNPRAQNPRAQNENIVNNEMENPRAQNPRAQNAALTDMTWTVSNDGNTTSAYSFNIVSNSEEIRNLFNQTDPPLIAQVLVYKVHKVPIDNECQLLQTHADELIVNVTNPRAQNPRAQNTAPTARNITTLGINATTQQNSDTQDITFNLAPGEEAEVTFRVYDPDINDTYSFDGYIDNFAGETEAEAVNTGEDYPILVTQPAVPWVSPVPAIVAVPGSFSFSTTGDKTLQLSVSGLSGTETLPYSLSADVSWLSVSPSGGMLGNSPVDHTVTVANIDGLPAGTNIGTITASVPEAYNNPLRIPVYLNTSSNLLPNMAVYAKDSLIVDGGTYDFGSAGPGTTSDVAFSIANNGSTNLILGGKPIITITGANADQFSVQQQPVSPVLADGNTAFIVRFKPTSLGSKTAAISIANNTLAKNPYDIALQGTSVAASLVAYYPFNGNANDESGNGHNATVIGASLTQDQFGNPNSAYAFNGTSDYLEAQSPDFNITRAITIAAWVEPNINNTLLPIVNKYRSDLGYRAYWFYGWTSGQQGPRWRVCTGGSSEYIGEAFVDELLPTTSWSFVAGTYDGSDVKLYINGTLRHIGTVSGMINTNSLPLRIGADNELPPSYFNGKIDDVRIYNGALSATEILQLYNQQVPPPGFVTKWGNSGTGDGQFGDGPYFSSYGIEVDSSGNVYVADTGNDRIQKFTSTGTFLGWWGLDDQNYTGWHNPGSQRIGQAGSGSGQFSLPWGIAIDNSGNIYVADANNARIQKFTSDTTFTTQWGTAGSGDGQFVDMRGIEIDSSGNIYVADANNYRIQKFASTGAFLGWWGRDDENYTGWHNPGSQRIGVVGTGDGQFNHPEGVAVDAFGYVYVTDFDNNRVQKFTSTGTFLGWWGYDDQNYTGWHNPGSQRIGRAGSGSGQFIFPRGIAVDGSGNVNVIDSPYNGRVQIFISDGTFVTKWGSYGNGNGQFYLPEGIAIDTSGNIYVVDKGNYRIQKFR